MPYVTIEEEVWVDLADFDTDDLEEDIFNQLVLDEWQWKNAFTATGALYKSF